MANIQPDDIPLPAILDTILSYLSDTLPYPVYSFLISLLSHCLALFTALYALVMKLLSTHPLQWDAQTILPPLIAVLASYLAILSLYRTTSWMIRTSAWFIKWGVIFGALVAALGWVVGAGYGNEYAIGNGRGLVAGLGGTFLDLLNGKGQNAAGGSRSKTRMNSNSRSRLGAGKRGPPLRKPKPWDSFELHREWQYQEEEVDDQGLRDAQQVISDFVGSAGKLIREGSWWEVAKSTVWGNKQEDEQGRTSRKQAPRTAKAKGKTSASR